MYNVQLTLSSVTFQGNIEIGPHNTGLIDMKCTVKGNKNYCLIEVVTKASLTVHVMAMLESGWV